MSRVQTPPPMCAPAGRQFVMPGVTEKMRKLSRLETTWSLARSRAGQFTAPGQETTRRERRAEEAGRKRRQRHVQSAPLKQFDLSRQSFPNSFVLHRMKLILLCPFMKKKIHLKSTKNKRMKEWRCHITVSSPAQGCLELIPPVMIGGLEKIQGITH